MSAFGGDLTVEQSGAESQQELARIAAALRPILLSPALLVIGGPQPSAEEQFDPAALAQTIAPFIPEETIAVARLDLKRVAVDPLVEKFGELLPEQKEDLARAKPAANAWGEAFFKAGGRDVYAVVTLAARPPRRRPIVVIPQRPGADENMLHAIFPVRPATTGRVGDAMVAADTPEDVEWVRRIKPDPRPELAAAFEAAGDSAVQLLLLPPKYTQRVIEETMPQLPAMIGGGPSSVLTRGVQWAAVGIDLPPRMALRVVVKSQDAQAAEALRARWPELLRLAAQQKDLNRLVTALDAMSEFVVSRVEGDRLVLVLNEENKGISNLLAALQPVIEQARMTARRSRAAINLKQIALAMLHNFHGGKKDIPAAASYGPDGKPLLSWRVHILYSLGHDLYKEFHLDEPWDSPHNKALIAKMPAVYRSPMSKLREPGRTNYVVAVGPGTVFSGREGMTYRDIKDGTSVTILTVEVADQHAVIWTEPDDLPYDPKDPAKGLGGLYKDGFNAGFCDGSVHFIPLPQPAETLRRLFEAADGKPVKWP